MGTSTPPRPTTATARCSAPSREGAAAATGLGAALLGDLPSSACMRAAGLPVFVRFRRGRRPGARLAPASAGGERNLRPVFLAASLPLVRNSSPSFCQPKPPPTAASSHGICPRPRRRCGAQSRPCCRRLHRLRACPASVKFFVAVCAVRDRGHGSSQSALKSAAGALRRAFTRSTKQPVACAVGWCDLKHTHAPSQAIPTRVVRAHIAAGTPLQAVPTRRCRASPTAGPQAAACREAPRNSTPLAPQAAGVLRMTLTHPSSARLALNIS